METGLQAIQESSGPGRTWPEPEPGSDLTRSGLLRPSEAVQFWAGWIIDKIEAEGLPKELGPLAMIAGPFIKKGLAKLASIDDEQAREIIRAVHALSSRLEDQTGEDSPFHYADE